MRINEHVRKVWKLRVWAGLLTVLLLASVEFWMVCRFGHDFGGTTSPQGNEAPGLSDLLAAR
jgi:hypothetical protein